MTQCQLRVKELRIGGASLPFGLYLLEIIMVEVAVKFDPEWVSPPGDTIVDLLEERGWPQSELRSEPPIRQSMSAFW